MGIFRQFPYSNFHEMNLDWIISKSNELIDEWKLYTEQWDKWQTIINNKIDMVIGPDFPFITPQMFGAIGDGTHDDLTAFNDALASIDSGVIYVPKGVYYLSNQFVINKSHILLYMAPDAFIFSTNATTNGQTIGVFNINNQLTDGGVPINYANWEWLEDIHIVGGHVYNTSPNGTENAIGFGRGIKDCSVRNVTIDYCSRKGITAQYGIKNFVIDSCTIKNCLNNGISVETSIENNPSVRINNCYVYNCSNGIFCTLSASEISNCVVEGCGTGIYISAGVGTNVTDCKSINSAVYGILNSNNSDTSFSNCYIDTAGTAGFQAWNATTRLSNSFIINVPIGVNSPQTNESHGKILTIDNVKIANASNRGVSLLYPTKVIIKGCNTRKVTNNNII